MSFVLGIFLCLLLCVFAVSAKSALYDSHPHRLQSLTATKVWKGSGTAADVATNLSTQYPPAVATVLLLAVLALFASEQPLEFARVRRRVATRGPVRSSEAVRPPPVSYIR